MIVKNHANMKTMTMPSANGDGRADCERMMWHKQGEI